MTTQKHLKQLVRARMQKTGERYAAARRQVLAQQPAVVLPPSAAAAHLPGSISATTALRIQLQHLGQPWSESQLFVAAGGIGAGVFAFLYEKEDFASLYVAGRHKWHDDLDFLKSAAARLGLKPVVNEATGAKAGLQQLRTVLETGRPVIAWADAAHLPHRALPAHFSGGGYHLVSIYAIEGENALIGDRGDQPVSISLDDLAIARSRIKKQKHRLLWLELSAKPATASRAIADGIAACARELTTCKMKNYRLDAFEGLADRMVGGKSKESWERMFPPGSRLWTALTSLHDYIEHYGTGGGLSRPIFAEGLAASGRADDARRYDALGKQWSLLADSALPDAFAATRAAKELLTRKAELTASGGDPEEIRGCVTELAALAAQAKKHFPLTDAQSLELRVELQGQLRAIAQAETSALGQLSGSPVKGEG